MFEIPVSNGFKTFYTVDFAYGVFWGRELNFFNSDYFIFINEFILIEKMFIEGWAHSVT